MTTNSSNWVNGNYYLVKRAYKLSNLVGGKGPFGYLTMQEIALEAELNRCNSWVGYWESPRKAFGCTFKAVRLSRHMPVLFIPMTYVDILDLRRRAEYESEIARVAYVRRAERHSGRADIGDPQFVKLMRALNAPCNRLHEAVYSPRIDKPSDICDSVMIHQMDEWILPPPTGIAVSNDGDCDWDQVDSEQCAIQQ